MKRSQGPSLRARALQALAQREYSRAELRAKLLRAQTARAPSAAQRDEAFAADRSDDVEATGDGTALEPTVDALLDELQARGLLDDSRFVESRIHLRAPRFGNLRIRQELKRHGVTLDEASAAELRHTELQRAQAVWARRFGKVAESAAERARQVRFLGARGFSAETISQVLRGVADDPSNSGHR